MGIVYLVTKVTLPDGHDIIFEPAVEFVEGEPIKLTLDFAGRRCIECKAVEWYEYNPIVAEDRRDGL